MDRRVFLLAAVGAFLGLVVGFIAWGARSEASGVFERSPVVTLTPVEAPVVGGLAPGFEADTSDGGRFQLDEARGRMVVLNFWATWCDPCRDEMSMLQACAQEHASRLLVLGVNAGETAAQVTAYGNALGLDFPLLLDVEGEIQRLYRIRGFPTTVFVDEAGMIRQVHIGSLDEEALDGYLEAIGQG